MKLNDGPEPQIETSADKRAFRKHFYRVSDRRGAFDLVFYGSAIVLTVVTAQLFHRWEVYAGAFVLMVWLQHALLNLQHDAWHRLLFASRPWSDFVGAWFYSYPIGVPFYHAMQRHIQ